MNPNRVICVLVVILCARVKSERNVDVISEPDINVKSESLKDSDQKLSSKELVQDDSTNIRLGEMKTDAIISDIWSEITTFFKSKLEESVKIDKESPNIQKFDSKANVFAKAFQIGDNIEQLNIFNDMPIIVLDNITKPENFEKISNEDILSAIKNVQEKEFQRIAGKQEQHINNKSKTDENSGEPITIRTSFKVESQIFDKLETIISSDNGNNGLSSTQISNNDSPAVLTKSDDYLGRNIENEIAKNSENNVEYNEIYHEDFPLNIDYGIEDDNSTDYPIIDYVNFYAEYTNEYVDITEGPVTENNNYETDNIGLNTTKIDNVKEITSVEDGKSQNLTSAVSPWLAAIFIRSNDTNQFMYYCDGAVLNETSIITAARCVNTSKTINVEDFIVILGKKSLHTSVHGETVHKVKQIKLHENFTLTSENHIENDLAVLYLDEPAIFSDSIQPAVFDCNSERVEENANAITTAWALSGELEIVFFEKNRKSTCPLDEDTEKQFCATFGDEVPLCPSYGGLYLTNLSPNNTTPTSSKWCLQGLRSADPSNRGVCFDKTVTYTKLSNYKNWISGAIGNY